MRPLLVVTLLMAAAFVPTASAGPDCLQVYPWSKICEGELPIAVDCIAMSPWWELCNGNVPGAVDWLTGGILP